MGCVDPRASSPAAQGGSSGMARPRDTVALLPLAICRGFPTDFILNTKPVRRPTAPGARGEIFGEMWGQGKGFPTGTDQQPPEP